MSGVIQFLKGNAVLLALVAIVLIQQSELKEMERTLNYIYASVQSNNDDIQVVLDDHIIKVHVKFAAWCRHCVRGRAQEGQHRRNEAGESKEDGDRAE